MAGNPRVRGVLRHKHLVEAESKDKFEDLLVFGYACKLFRDDEKASNIDQGKFLIPWMGDDSIKIDRYDARGTLFDLKSLETPQGGYDRTDALSLEEKHIEELCDEERYFALYKDEAEEAVIKEEEIKRLNQDLSDVTSEEKSYHQVPFCYSSESQDVIPRPSEVVKSTLGELGDTLYVPPPSLDVPADMAVPPTQKLARIVEKTAQFISSQGTQMEIIVKAKQANNSMFQFLHFDSPLHPFYRHVLAAIRNGTYVILAEDDAENSEKVEESNGQANEQINGSDSESDNYLHPSLQSKVPEKSDSSPKSETDQASSSFPPPESRPLIDKTASYMSRKGRHLESVVLAKGDARFSFLDEGHLFHPYYAHKLLLYSEMHRNTECSLPVVQQASQSNASETRSEKFSSDVDIVKSERRKKAAQFLDRIKREKVVADENNDCLDEDGPVDSDSTSSAAKKSKSRSPDESIFITIASAPETATKPQSQSQSSPYSQSQSTTKYEPVKATHSKHEKRREKKRRRSRDRSRKKSRRHRSRSASRSPSESSRSRSRSPVKKSRSPSEPRRSPMSSAVRKLAGQVYYATP
nr:EOG090X07RL [Eurycercus lamellatus]